MNQPCRKCCYPLCKYRILAGKGFNILCNKAKPLELVVIHKLIEKGAILCTERLD